MNTTIQNQLEKYGTGLFFLYLLGFVIGICFVNLMRQNMVYGFKTLGIYLLQEQEMLFSMKEYFFELLKDRGILYLFYIMAGVTMMGVMLVTAGLLWSGFLAGSLLTMFFTEYGLRGMLLGFACFFPQCLLYIPAIGMLYLMTFQISIKRWKKEKLTLQNYKWYGSGIIVCGMLYLCGIFLESYVNYFVIELVKEVF